MTTITETGTIVQYKTNSGVTKGGMLTALNNPLVPTWDLVVFSADNGTFLGSAHLNVANDQSLSSDNTFKVISGSVPF